MIYRVLLKDMAFQLGGIASDLKTIRSLCDSILTITQKFDLDAYSYLIDFLPKLISDDKLREEQKKVLETYRTELTETQSVYNKDAYEKIIEIFSSKENTSKFLEKVKASYSSSADWKKDFENIFKKENSSLFARINRRAFQIATKNGIFDKGLYDKIMSEFLKNSLYYANKVKMSQAAKKEEENENVSFVSDLNQNIANFFSSFQMLVKKWVNLNRHSFSQHQLQKITYDYPEKLLGVMNHAYDYFREKRSDIEKSIGKNLNIDSIHQALDKLNKDFDDLNSNRGIYFESLNTNDYYYRFKDVNDVIDDANQLRKAMGDSRLFSDFKNDLEKMEIKYNFSSDKNKAKTAAKNLLQRATDIDNNLLVPNDFTDVIDLYEDRPFIKMNDEKLGDTFLQNRNVFIYDVSQQSLEALSDYYKAKKRAEKLKYESAVVSTDYTYGKWYGKGRVRMNSLINTASAFLNLMNYFIQVNNTLYKSIDIRGQTLNPKHYVEQISKAKESLAKACSLFSENVSDFIEETERILGDTKSTPEAFLNKSISKLIPIYEVNNESGKKQLLYYDWLQAAQETVRGESQKKQEQNNQEQNNAVKIDKDAFYNKIKNIQEEPWQTLVDSKLLTDSDVTRNTVLGSLILSFACAKYLAQSFNDNVLGGGQRAYKNTNKKKVKKV